MNKELYRKTFSKLRASDQAKEELMNMAEEKKTGKTRTLKVARNVLIAAVLCLALVGSAFAAGVLEISENGYVVLGMFARGLVQDADGNIAESVDPEKIESGAQTVLMPEYTIGAKLAEENGRLILYYQYGPAEGREDVTDAMLEDGTYSMSGAKDGCELSVTVVPCPEEELEEHHYLLFYRGVGYYLNISGKFPAGEYVSHDEAGNEKIVKYDGSTFTANGFSSYTTNTSGVAHW